MITILVAGVFGAFLANKRDKELGFFWGGILGFILGFLLFFFIGGFLPVNNYEIRTELVSLRNKSEVDGSFFLGFGSIDEEEYYFYFVKQDDGSIVREKMAAEGVRIFEDQEKTGYISTTGVNPTIRWSWLVGMRGNCLVTQETLHIPAGSIQRNFVLE